MEAKLKALKEVEQIYRLSKKWRRNMPDEKRPDFERMADERARQFVPPDRCRAFLGRRKRGHAAPWSLRGTRSP